MDEEAFRQILTIDLSRKEGVIRPVNTDQRLKRLCGQGLLVFSTLGVGTTESSMIPANR